MEKRNLSDADIKALADEMEQRMVSRFYNNLGRGIWGLIWRGIVTVALMVAAYGSVKGWSFH